jgi:thioredoxin reductase (NADPH)
MEKIHQIAIIGAGPAGIASAVESVIFELQDIIVFEKGPNHSETIRKFFDDKKPVDRDWRGISVELKGNINFEDGTKEDTLNLFDRAIEEHLIDAKFKTEVVEILKEESLFRIITNTNESFLAKNIVVAIGKMGKPNKPDYAIPKTLKKQIHHNISECQGDEDILVVGGGDSALEFAYFIRHGNRVTLSYRKEEITRANPKNLKNLLDSANKGEIELKLGVDIVSVEDQEGKCLITYADGTTALYDRIIYGLGGSTPKEFLANSPVLLDAKNKPIVNETNYNDKGVYLAGDIAGSLGGSIALALNHGYNIIQHILEERE